MRAMTPFVLLLLATPASAVPFQQSCASSAATQYGQSEPWIGIYCSCAETSLSEMGIMHVITEDGGSPRQQSLADQALEMCEIQADNQLLARAQAAVSERALQERSENVLVTTLVHGLGASATAMLCANLSPNYLSLNQHFRRLEEQGVDLASDPFRTIWDSATEANQTAIQATPSAACGELRQRYGPEGTVVPGLVSDQ